MKMSDLHPNSNPMRPLVDPVLNINGTHAGQLIEMRTEICDALNDAIAAMKRAAPHGRDYQTINPHCMAAGQSDPFAAWVIARDAWNDRILGLIAIRDEIFQQALDIQDDWQNSRVSSRPIESVAATDKVVKITKGSK